MSKRKTPKKRRLSVKPPVGYCPIEVTAASEFRFGHIAYTDPGHDRGFIDRGVTITCEEGAQIVARDVKIRVLEIVDGTARISIAYD